MTSPTNYYDGIGGSMCAAIMGLDPHKTPYQAWREYLYPEERQDISNEEPVIWGNVLEAPVGFEAARRLGIEVVHQPNKEPARHARIPFMQAHVDFLQVGGDAGLECKNRGLFMLRQYDLAAEGVEDQVLPVEAIQVHHYMTVMERPTWYLAVLVGGQRLLTFKFARDLELSAQIERKCEEFWGYVQRREPPPPINVEDCNRMWPGHVAPAVVIEEGKREEWLGVHARHEELKNIIKAAEEELEFLTFRIKSTMRDAEKLICGPKTLFTWTKNRDGEEVDVKRLKEERPEVAAAYMKAVTGARVLRRKRI